MIYPQRSKQLGDQLKNDSKLGKSYRLVGVTALCVIAIVIWQEFYTIPAHIGSTIKPLTYYDSTLNKVEEPKQINQLLIFLSSDHVQSKEYEDILEKSIVPILKLINYEYRIIEVYDALDNLKSGVTQKYFMEYSEFKSKINQAVPYITIINKDREVVFDHIGSAEPHNLSRVIYELNYSSVTETKEVVRQESVNDCGPCCAKMMLERFGVKKELNDIKQILNGNVDEPVSLLALNDFFSTFDLPCVGLRVPIEKWIHLPLPVIAHYKTEHFVVVSKVEKDIIGVKDPAEGYKEYSYKEFQELYSQVILAVDLERYFEKKENDERRDT